MQAINVAAPTPTFVAAIAGAGLGMALSVPNIDGIWSWITTVDHKRIGIMYFLTSFFFFFVGYGP